MAVDPTPIRTPEEIHVNFGLTGGRLSAALQELKRRLEIQVPAQIDYENTRQGLDASLQMTKPAAYGFAPAELTDAYINNLLIGASVQLQPQPPRAHKALVTVTIYLVDQPVKTDEQVVSGWDAAEVVAAVMYDYMSMTANQAGQVVWRSLTPLNRTALPSAYAGFSGIALNYLLIQDPTDQLWS